MLMVTTSMGMLNRLKQQQAVRTEQAEKQQVVRAEQAETTEQDRTGAGQAEKTALKQTQGNNHHFG